MLTIVYLCRHAAYENPKQIMHLRLPGFPLSERGIAQAKKLAVFLSKESISAIYSSPLTRAVETATFIAKPHKLKIVTDERLLDLLSPLQGKSLAYMTEIKFAFFRREFIKAGGERLAQVYARMNSLIKEKIKEHLGQEIVIVSHGDPIMSIIAKYTGGKLYTRRIFDGNYIGTSEGFRLTFEGTNFKNVERITKS